MTSSAKAKRADKKVGKKVGKKGAAKGEEGDLGMKDLKLTFDRSATGVLTSQASSRDIKIESFTLSFHGRLLISNATIELNFGRRYGLLGSNGSGKSTFLNCLAAREVPIPMHTDVSLFFFTILACLLIFLDLPFE